MLVTPKSAAALGDQTIASLTNQQRASAGLAPLSWNAQLATSASLKVQDMCAKDYWAHTSPDGLTPWTFMQRAGYSYYTAGENLGKGFSTDSGLLSAWMNSPTHRANILNASYTEMGVANMTCSIQGQTTIVVAAHYGSRSPVRAPASTATAKSAPKQYVRPIAQKPAPKPTSLAATIPQNPIANVSAQQITTQPKIIKPSIAIIEYVTSYQAEIKQPAVLMAIAHDVNRPS